MPDRACRTSRRTVAGPIRTPARYCEPCRLRLPGTAGRDRGAPPDSEPLRVEMWYQRVVACAAAYFTRSVKLAVELEPRSHYSQLADGFTLSPGRTVATVQFPIRRAAASRWRTCRSRPCADISRAARSSPAAGAGLCGTGGRGWEAAIPRRCRGYARAT